MIIFDARGRYLRSWGKGLFTSPHGLRIDPAGNVWITDVGSQQVIKFTQKGELLLTLGKKGQAGATRDTFNKPTDIAFARNGDFYVSDGYGNTRIVKFSKDGRYLFEWGKPGRGPGEFNTPHSVQLDSKGVVYVSDRENNRIQIFTPEGKFLRMWTHPRLDPEHLYRSQRRNVDDHASGKRGSGRAEHSGRTNLPCGYRHRQDSWFDRKSRPLDPRDAGSSHLYREPDRQRAALVSRLAKPVSAIPLFALRGIVGRGQVTAGVRRDANARRSWMSHRSGGGARGQRRRRVR